MRTESARRSTSSHAFVVPRFAREKFDLLRAFGHRTPLAGRCVPTRCCHAPAVDDRARARCGCDRLQDDCDWTSGDCARIMEIAVELEESPARPRPTAVGVMGSAAASWGSRPARSQWRRGLRGLRPAVCRSLAATGDRPWNRTDGHPTYVRRIPTPCDRSRDLSVRGRFLLEAAVRLAFPAGQSTPRSPPLFTTCPRPICETAHGPVAAHA